jgi:alanyl-tRNA synthetase
MDSREIRSLYLNYFKEKGHTVVSTSGLVPFDDPTLLFTNAGMVQFKKFWATSVPLPYSRAVTCQKCMRAGGKDSDIDKIGTTGRHHTFFEMLGNFSFGDYFKKETIEWAYEFVIEYLKIPKKDIWVSYYEKDIETRNIWEKFLPEGRIIPLSEKDNFWGPAGDTGPCGPCTEIYLDFGEEFSCSKDCKPGCECGRFLEFWNLVFPQYDKQKNISLPSLKRRGVDTGMGLERIARILQKTPSNYETDLFLPIIKEIEVASGQSYDKQPDKKPLFRITADHIRAAVFLIDDNILPSNEGRGYVLRRILRRASITASNLGIKESFLNHLSKVPIKIMYDVYPSLKEHQELIKRVILEEEEKFHALLGSASKNFYDFVSDIKENVIPGSVAFKLYDTYGIPKDLLEELSSQSDRMIDWKGFNEKLIEQKQLSRFSTKIGMQKKAVFEKSPLTETLFTGYSRTEDEGNVVAVYHDAKKDLFSLVLDRTPFYSEKGGQIGDHGTIENEHIRFKVVDTQADEKGLIYHIGRIEKGGQEQFEKEIRVKTIVDPGFRKQVSINHTATHLLHYALRKILGSDVRQAGSFVTDERLRFDFVCFTDLSEEIIKRVESIVQNKIIQNSPVSVEEMSLDDARKKGAMALFLEKYGEKVRVVQTGDYHAEVCGGTHIKRTGDMLIFQITGFSSIGKNLKRIEAVTYKSALTFLTHYKKVVDELALKLEVESNKVQQKIDNLLIESDEKNRIIIRYEDILSSKLSDDIAGEKEVFEINGSPCYFASGLLNMQNNDVISKISDEVMFRIKEGIVFLGNISGNKIFLVIKVSGKIKEKFPAVKIMKEVSGLLEGQGGGNPLFARGSGKNNGNFLGAVQKIREIIKGK